ncbi:hypothetical protein BH23BAC2_BH23BAC2_27770 [soil metagenome]
MKNKNLEVTFKYTIFILLAFLVSFPVWAQIPQGIPNDPNSLNIDSTQEKLLYLVLPVVILAIATYWYYKRARRKSQEESENNPK